MSDKPEIKATLTDRSVALIMATVAAKMRCEKDPMKWVYANLNEYIPAARDALRDFAEPTREQALMAEIAGLKAKLQEIAEHPIFPFLNGAGELDGMWFGCTAEGDKPLRSKLWWRKQLRELIDKARNQPEPSKADKYSKAVGGLTKDELLSHFDSDQG